MIRSYRRYIFLHYEDLQQMKVKKLEKVCDRAYVFIDQKAGHIPLSMVQKLQKLGKLIHWAPMSLSAPEEWRSYVSYYLGKCHGETPLDIEFLLLFDRRQLEGVIRLINKGGRSCRWASGLPVEKQESLVQDDLEPDFPVLEEVALPLGGLPDSRQRSDALEDFQIDQIARDIVERLLESGNRPAEVEMLKEYIQIYQPGIQQAEKLEEVIHKLAEATEIEIRGGEVIYNF